MNQKFEKFFIEYYPKVKSFALRILMSEHDAEDVTQDIFLKILEMKEEKVNEALLFTMTRNHIFNLLKRRTIERKYQEYLLKEDFSTESLNLEKKIYAEELELLALNIIEKMPEQRRKIFTMSRFEGKKNKEIAKELNLSVRTVERHIYLALTELKRIMFLFFLFFIE